VDSDPASSVEQFLAPGTSVQGKIYWSTGSGTRQFTKRSGRLLNFTGVSYLLGLRRPSRSLRVRTRDAIEARRTIA